MLVKDSTLFHRNIRQGSAEADQIKCLAQNPLKTVVYSEAMVYAYINKNQNSTIMLLCI